MRLKEFMFLILIVLIIGQKSIAQVPVMDNLLKNKIKDNRKQNTSGSLALEFFSELSEQTKDTVTSTFDLQYNYQQHLKQTTSTANLEFFTLENFAEEVKYALQTTHHLNDYSFATNLNNIYHSQTEPSEKSKALYEQFVPFDPTLIFSNLSDFNLYQKQRMQNVVALEEMAHRRKLQLAKSYQLIAQERIEKANQLQALLKQPERFSMNESERLELMTTLQQYLQSALTLKTKADQLMRESKNYSAIKSRTLNTFENQIERSELSKTSLHDE